MYRHAAISIALLALVAAIAGAAPPAAGPAGIEFFEKKVRPVLAERCYQCHGPKKQEAGLRLDSRGGILRGGDRGPAIAPGQPGNSRLVRAIGYTDKDLLMPPKGKLPDRIIADLTRWIEMGAPAPDEPPAPAASAGKAFDMAERMKHWSFQPIRAPKRPKVANASWPRSAIDRFILARLETASLSPAPAADRRTWLRRVTFALIGLPPTPEEVDAFLADQTPEAYARTVDRLLDSPHFGERWARHWLDLVRYAETRGHEFDYVIPNAYLYRDYVIRAFNADVPYDRFVSEHIAGDQLAKPRLHPDDGYNESVLGTGFWHLSEEVHSPVDIRGDETDRIDNKLDVFGKTFLGLAIGCARCHDHKFDPLRAEDYYALAGFVAGGRYGQVRFESMEHNRKIARRLDDLHDTYRPHVLRTFADATRPAVRRTADYLLAACEVLGTGDGSVATVAASRSLDAGVLDAWLDEVKRAKDHADHPLHAWALVAHDTSADGEQRIARTLESLVNHWDDQEKSAADALRNAKVIVDYADLGSDDWLPDGHAFGAGPVRAGDVQLGTDPARPISRVFPVAAAQKDATWDVLKLAPGTQGDPGRVKWVQAGRTLRTRTFTLATGRLFYLVKGSGYAYAAVDSHRLLNGPLHGALTRQWNGPDEWHWVEQNLTAYPGHRVHVEFSPKRAGEVKDKGSSDLAIGMIVEADQAPAVPHRPNRLLRRILADQANHTPARLAQAYQRLFADTLDRLGAGRIRSDDNAADFARLADWIVRTPALFPPTASSPDPTCVENPAAAYRAQRDALVARIRTTSRTAPSMMAGAGVDAFVLRRGNHRTPGPAVPRRFFEAIAGPDQPPIVRGDGRLELARRMTDPSNPFLARVMVNRVWHHLFGRGIVASVDNFGLLGKKPTHPALLDHLATHFVEQGWSIKKLIRGIVLTSTYRMASKSDPIAVEQDPANFLLHHMPIRRLEAEAVRDAILAVSGRLDHTPFGPSVPVHLTAFMEGRGRPKSGPLDGNGRRSIYVAIRRNFLDPMMLTFDRPIPFNTVGRRGVSNVPAQALTLMNSPLVVQQAEHWAESLVADQALSPSDRIIRAYQTAFARPPSAQELQDALDFLDAQRQRYKKGADDPAVWADLCHVLMNVKEFIFIR